MTALVDSAVLIIGLLVLVLGLLSGLIRRTVLSESALAFSAGLLLGPAVFGVVDLADYGPPEQLLEQVARLTLAVGLMVVALRLPRTWIPANARPLALLLVAGMAGMWLITSGLSAAVLGLGLWPALLLGAVLTPTDPVVATSIVTGEVAEKSVAARLRHLISAESGANDGLALPLVLLPVMALTHGGAAPWSHWLLVGVLQEVGVGVLLGALLGWLAGRALAWAEDQGIVEQTSFLGYTLALCLVVLGLPAQLGGDGILAVFVAGLVYASQVPNVDRLKEERLQEAVDRFLSLPIFALLGLAAPIGDWAALGWRGPALALAILLLRRLPVVLLLRRGLGCVHNLPETVYLGWFGPIGVAAVFYALFAVRETGAHELWPAASLVVVASIFAHGLTATPGSRLLARLAPPEEHEQGEHEAETESGEEKKGEEEAADEGA